MLNNTTITLIGITGRGNCTELKCKEINSVQIFQLLLFFFFFWQKGFVKPTFKVRLKYLSNCLFNYLITNLLPFLSNLNWNSASLN